MTQLALTFPGIYDGLPDTVELESGEICHAKTVFCTYKGSEWDNGGFLFYIGETEFDWLMPEKALRRYEHNRETPLAVLKGEAAP